MYLINIHLVPLSFDSTGGEKNKKAYKELSHNKSKM